MSEEQNQQQFAIQKIYLKDASFESPNSPDVFQDAEWKPEINVQLNTEGKTLAEGVHEVTLTVTVTAKKADKTAFLVEVKQSGVFQLVGFEQEQLGGMLGAYCPEVLFPFAREAISDLVSKGGFPQLLLSPVNFNALYMQHQQQQAQQAEQAH
ncbi:MAG: protein-export chaperone SecB [Gammaproteobacteria bacterium]|nr:protein-export chaperone SecB [Gammaproteobacteria bacterium]MCW8910493.1 protein-export chaperone SecB [Gammaproteobacteria bacterium]MCW9004685.1 protein-export chaperone SecB [Gammaproteobacteria bacterium]MCW9056791.1 protein-export chaperone SecB [Gammaproteobacteria bacterium]